MTPTCTRCQDTFWVCEKHLEQPWSDDLPNGCACGAGVPCPDCRPRASRLIRRIRGAARPDAEELERKRPGQTASMAHDRVKRRPAISAHKRAVS